jgi:hypothetical protein
MMVLVNALTVLSSAMLLAAATPLCAQGVEIAPIAGWRAGGAVFTTLSGDHLHRDTPAVGAIVDVPLGGGLQFEAGFSRQRSGDLTTDHWQAGGVQEFLPGRARPFLTGVFGLTHYGVGGSNELRFMTAAGGGVKLFPTSRVGLRLDGRLFATFLDADGTAVICGGSGPCFIRLHLDVAWQGEFTIGLVFRVP